MPIKPFLPPYSSPPRLAQPLRPELLDSPGYSPARPVPEALLRPSPRKNGLNMRGKGGSYRYQAPEEIERSEMRNTLNEEERERAQKARAKLIFDPNFINSWERGNPFAHQQLANLGRIAAGEKPLEPLPVPPPAPAKIRRLKPIFSNINNNNNNNNDEPVTAPVAPKKPSKRPRNNNTEKMKIEQRRRTRRLKNRRHK